MIHITNGQTDEILDFIRDDFYWEEKHYKSLKDNVETFDFKTFANKRFSQYLGNLNRVVIPDEDGQFVEFVITNAFQRRNPNTGALEIEVYTSASYIMLAKAKVIDPQTLPTWTAQQHAEWALAGTEWQVGDVYFAGSRAITIENPTEPYSFLKKIASEFGLELHFRVEKSGGKIVRRYVDLIKRVGDWHGQEIVYRKNLMGIERSFDDNNIVTALVGYGPQRDDGTRMKVFVEDKDALARWGRNNQHLVGYYEPESTDQNMTEEQLTELTRNELEKRINSLVEYKVDTAVFGNYRLGDTVRVKDTEFNPPLYLEARVHTMERSPKKGKENGKTITLGDFVEYTEEDVLAVYRRLQAEIAKKVSLVEVKEVVYTKQEVDEKDNTVKEEAAQDATNKANQAEENSKQYVDVREVHIKGYADQQAQQAEQRAVTQAESIAEQKKQLAIQQAIADAETKINAAKSELEADIATKVDAQWVNGQLVLKENAITKSNTAPSNPTVGQLWLDTSVTPNVLKRWSGSAWVKATPTSAGEVGAYTKTEVDNALSTKVSVTQYNTDMNGVVTRLNSAESRLTLTEQGLETKVSTTQYQQDKTTINNNISQLQTKMSNAETSISQLSSQIALKANATDVYTKSQVDGQFSTVNQQITNLSAQLTIQADQIATKVSRTEFESFNDIKNLTKLNGIELVDQSFKSGIWGDLSDKNNKSSITNEVVKAGYSYSIKTVGYAWITTGFIPINPELPTYISFDVYYKDNTNSVLYAGLEHYDKDKVPTEGNGGCVVYHINNKTVTSANAWQTFEGWRETMPKNTKFVRLRLLVRYNNSTNDISYIQNISVRQIGANIAGEYNSRLSTAETSITQLSNQIQLKANQTTVDTLTNQISSAQSQINLLSDEIDLKVDKDGVISAINVSSEGVRITGNKIIIDGTTSIANGVIKTAHIGDGQITNAKIANLAVNDAKIANLSASKLTAGTINVNNVSISNDKVTIDSTGVVANDSTFRLKDSVTQTESIVRENSNMLADHSFEMIPRTGSVDGNQTFLVDRSRFGNYFWWNVWGSSSSSARVLSTYDTGLDQMARFGKQAIVCANVSTYYWIQFVEVSRHSTSTYTLSAYFAAYGGTTQNCQGQLVIQAYDANFTWIADVANGTVDIIASEKFRWKRCVCTTTSLPSGTAYLRVRINAIGSFVLCDGVQLVPFAYPTVYEAEEGLWKMMNGQAGYTPEYFVARNISVENRLYVGSGELLLESERYFRIRALSDSHNGSIVIDRTNQSIGFYLNGAFRHLFNANGTKTGGSIEIDGEVLGMSPIDSPQVLLSTLFTDVEIKAGQENIILLDEKFAKSIDGYAVFTSQNVTITRKEKDRFYVSSDKDCVCDFIIFGKRIGYKYTYWMSLGA